MLQNYSRSIELGTLKKTPYMYIQIYILIHLSKSIKIDLMSFVSFSQKEKELERAIRESKNYPRP